MSLQIGKRIRSFWESFKIKDGVCTHASVVKNLLQKPGLF